MLWTISIAILLSNAAGATVLSDWPDWPNGKRTLKVYIRTAGAFKMAVQMAISDWNTANAGNNWMLMETATAAGADVSIGEGDPGAGNIGLATPKTKATGLFGWGSGVLQSVDVKVKPGLSAANRKVAIMHELGHCMRLDHTPGAADVMHESNPNTVPTAMDKAECKASDEDPPCPLEASKNLIRGIVSIITLFPKVASGIVLADVIGVAIEARTGPDFTANVLGWDASGIDVEFDVAPTADHNEVFRVELTHADLSVDQFTGVLTITDDDPSPGLLPHAVAGSDLVVEIGTPVLLDGRASYHDDPNNLILSGTWLVVNDDQNNDEGTGLFADYGPLDLGVGRYTAYLRVKDYYGRYSDDSISVTVTPRGVPALSTTALAIFTALLLATGALYRWRTAVSSRPVRP